MLCKTHRYATVFLYLFESLRNMPLFNLNIQIITDPSTNQWRYNPPTDNEIAIVLPGQASHTVQPRDIIVHNQGGDTQFMHNHHPNYVPLHYVLFFPYGMPGWTYDCLLNMTPMTTIKLLQMMLNIKDKNTFLRCNIIRSGCMFIKMTFRGYTVGGTFSKNMFAMYGFLLIRTDFTG